MAVTSALNVGSMVLWFPIFSLILRDLGASDLVIGGVSAASIIVSALLRYVGGRLTDRLGRVPMLVWPGVLSAVAIAIAAAARSWLPFAALYTLYMGGHALTDPVFASIVGESVPAAERGRAFGLVEFAIAAGVVVGPLVGAVLLPLTGAPGLLVVCGICLLAAAFLRGTRLVETRTRGRALAAFRVNNLFTPPLSRTLGVVVLVNVLLALNIWGPFLSLHAADAMGLSKPTINLLASAGAGAGLAVSFVCGRLVGRWGPGRMLRIASLALAVSAWAWSLQRGLPAIVAMYLLMNVAFQAAIIAMDTFRVHSIDEGIRGRALGAIGMFTGLFTAPIVPLASYLRWLLGSGAPFVMGVLPAAAAVWLLTRMDREVSSATTVVVAGR
jgi:MFS family permease